MGQSRGVILAVIVLLSLLLPGSLCVAAAVVPVRSAADLAVLVLAAGTWLGLLALVNWWEFTSIHLRWVWLAAFAAVAAWRQLDAGRLPVTHSFALRDVALAVLWLPAAWALVGALRARRPQVPPVDFALPFSPGRYLVTDGGDGARSFLVNYHYGFGRHRASGVNASMRFAVDIVAVGPGGSEARGFLPRSNDAYRIWHQPLLAPCGGMVVRVADGVRDNTAFGAHRPYGVGNHIVIRASDDVYVVLGHLAEASISVGVGQDVRAGDAIARVGNSGWTERPHLHMQAMQSADGDWWHGQPVPFCLGGRFPVRNQLVRM
jgi:Peptidase family M23